MAKEYVVEVAPAISLNVAPPLVEICHWTAGAGDPDAAAVKLTEDPAQDVWLLGLVVTAGGVVTVRVAAVVLEELHVLVNTARN